MNPLTLLQWLKANYKLIGAAILAVLLFAAGWMAHKKFTKPVTVTVKVPVTIANPEQPEKKVGDTVEPAHHQVDESELPKPPEDPLEHPTDTTVITLPPVSPQVIKVFHENKLSFAEQKEGYTVWVDGRVWATDALGHTLPGVHATTLFNKDVELFIPVTKQVPPEHPWAIGGIYGVSTGGGSQYGLFVDRDLAFIRLGIEVLQVTTDQNLRQNQLNVKAGFRF